MTTAAREDIARIIDPHAFVIVNSKRFEIKQRQEEAFAKADTILALARVETEPENAYARGVARGFEKGLSASDARVAELEKALAWALSEINLEFSRNKSAYPADPEKKKLFESYQSLTRPDRGEGQ